mmetsp:Transcript_67686/g.220377  ORF Transcript_67686/g.220377 Transcript_67686/m.220377 type:complete len:235 (-) Transcript_67686:1422-2126(-)
MPSEVLLVAVFCPVAHVNRTAWSHPRATCRRATSRGSLTRPLGWSTPGWTGCACRRVSQSSAILTLRRTATRQASASRQWMPPRILPQRILEGWAARRASGPEATSSLMVRGRIADQKPALQQCPVGRLSRSCRRFFDLGVRPRLCGLRPRWAHWVCRSLAMGIGCDSRCFLLSSSSLFLASQTTPAAIGRGRPRRGALPMRSCGRALCWIRSSWKWGSRRTGGLVVAATCRWA